MPAPSPPRATGDTQPNRRIDSMVLLQDLVEGSLDEGYARAAARRAEGWQPGRRHVWLLAVGLVAVGLLLATAFAQTRARAGSAQEARDALVTEVQQRTAQNERLARRLERQRSQVRRDQRSALELTGAGTALSDRLSRLEAATGAAAVSGPGMVVRLSDAGGDTAGADVDPRTQQDAEGRVTDRDLQTVVNEVWAAGAEAVSVNGQRLTGLSAIRSAGDAILVDFRPLSPPYVVRAIGDPRSLRTDFVAGFGGSYLQVLKSYGITSSVVDADRLTLSASAGVQLRYATAPQAPTSAPNPTTTGGDATMSRDGAS